MSGEVDATTSGDTAATSDVEEGVTMLDVLQGEQALEDDANAVLGNVSDTACTYPLGYLARQPVYACNTCSGADEQSGICLACSYHCHEGHSLVELYTKRQFRCDCGSDKLEAACKLEPGKEENTENKYNQNFGGLYCVCNRPYPDPEDPDTDDCMIQCVVCEDWYHGRHTGMGQAGPPDDSSYEEMICTECVAKLAFLQHYTGLAVVKVAKENVEDVEENIAVNVDTAGGDTIDTSDVDDDKVESFVKSNAGTVCCLSKPLSNTLTTTSSMFLPSGWRSALCKCSSCIQLYSDTRTTFLTQETDTVLHYESQACEKRNTLEQGMEALSQLDRVKQVEAIHSYNNMKENLMEYLAKFADSKKVVREDDIKTFFEEMKGNKKRKTEGGPPPSCK
eukprot:GFUD01019640.1.p1 GENE.GFUD01019640.1~~GFUD01019640.1.p1  ORF type:complete len:393 (-),score=140.07 GFUD01019640.1:77-1255(-)